MAVRSTPNFICSGKSSFYITAENVFSFGFSNFDEHGHEEDYIFPPKMISNLKNIKSISTGYHTVCLDNLGNVYTFGANEYGELGVGLDFEALRTTHIPQKIDLPPCREISSGRYLTVCITENNELYSFGDNGYGELGLGNKDRYNTPQLITSLKDAEFVECGYAHVFCKTLNNEIFCWGFNELGQLGLDNEDNQSIPVLCSSLSKLNIVDIKCGKYHKLVLTSNGDVLSCGRSTNGEIGRECDSEFSSSFQKIPELSEITRIECGNHHSMCIDKNNDLYVFGYNKDGQLGLDDTDDRDKPIKHPSLSNVIDISLRDANSSFVKTANNEIYAFGKNDFAQLGIETEDEEQLTPIRVFEDNEDIWKTEFLKSKAKSARSILPRPSNEDDNSPPLKKQKTN